MIENTFKEKLCLCIDTSAKTASVSVAKSTDGTEIEIIYSVFLNDGLTHSEKLLPLIDQCLTSCRIATADIDIFACVNGPGSFTGLRIGISTANALAQSVKKDIIGISSLSTLAYGLRHFEGLIIPMIDARRDNVYTAVYEFDGNKLISILKEDVKSVDELLEDIKDTNKKVIFTGCGSGKAKARAEMIFGSRAKFAEGILNSINAAVGVELALQNYFSNEYNEQKVLLPNYVKGTSAKTQAERNAEGGK